MSDMERRFLNALARFGHDPSKKNIDRLLAVPDFGSGRVQECGWPTVVSMGLLVRRILRTDRKDARKVAHLSSIADALAAAGASFAADEKAPTTPAAPIRQYKDD